jgi:hypothetical protein
MKSKLIPRGFCTIVSLGLLTATITNLRAATITVTSTADSGAGTLRATLGSANNGDTINFALPTPAKITLTSGELVVSNSVNILGPGTNNLAVDGNDEWRIFHVIGSNNTDTISGLTITNGYVQSGSGGGLNNQGASLTISNCLLAGNEASFVGGPFGGGAIFNAGQLVLIGSTLNGNTGYPNGGGICNNGVLAITNCTISGNQGGLHGGGIYNVADSTPLYNAVASLQVANSVISSNLATVGAGIENSANVNVNVVTTTATALIVGSTVSGNAMADSGGGLKNAANGASTRATLAVIASSITANQAGAGAGIDNRVGDGSAVVAITNCTISGNSAVSSDGTFSLGPGGGIFNGSNSGTGTVYVVNSTLASNVASTGNGLCVSTGGGPSKAVVGSSLFDGGASTGSVVTVVSGVLGVSAALASLGYNLCSDNGSGFLTNATDQINTDPMLGPLQDNGGPTFTHAPLPGSLAIDKGKNLSGSATDQRGLPRTFDKAAIPNAAGGDGTDIGAVESQSYTVVNTSDSGTGSLRQAIADSNVHLGSNTIDFAPSAYGTILLTSGELLITNNLFIAGPGATNEAVNGNAAGRIFHITNTIATIAGLTITNGRVPSAMDYYGGGIANENATLTVSDCVIIGNSGPPSVGASGCGLANRVLSGGTSSLTVVNSTITNNGAVGGYGGGIYNAAFSGNAVLTVLGSVITGNTTTNHSTYVILQGGGIYNFACCSGNATALVTNSTLAKNEATWGAGIYNSCSDGTSSVQIVRSTLNTNRSFSGPSAIGCVNANANLLVLNSTLSGNRGGGSAVAITGNGNQLPALANAQILNSTISGPTSGIGIQLVFMGDFGTLQIGSTILNGTGGGNISRANSGSVTSLGFNLSNDGNDSSLLTNATDQVNTDPMLGPLQHNGGPTFTHAPLPGSPAIDAGKNFSGSATDQRGLPRTLNLAGIPNAAGGDGTDIGAVEMDASLHLFKVGVVSNQFGFNLGGPFANVVVEASTNISGSNWTALVTNTLGDASLRFNDPSAPTLPRRFYRARLQ